jgi:hypothetical protein
LLDQKPHQIGDVLVGGCDPVLHCQEIIAHVLGRAWNEFQQLSAGGLQHGELALAGSLAVLGLPFSELPPRSFFRIAPSALSVRRSCLNRPMDVYLHDGRRSDMQQTMASQARSRRASSASADRLHMLFDEDHRGDNDNVALVRMSPRGNR